MGRSEELGTGIRNVYKYSNAYSGSDKVLFSEEDIFISKVPLNNQDLRNGGLNGGLTGGLTGGLNEKQQKLLHLIKAQEGIKTKDIAIQLEIPVDTIDKQIKVLVDKGLVERRGSKRTGGYYVIFTNS